MSLKDLSKDTREIVEPNRSKRVILQRPVSTQNQIESVDVSVEGYSNSFGGQLVDEDFEPIETEAKSDEIEITLPSPETSGVQGGDYLIDYSVEESGGASDTGQFFYQNGVYADTDAGTLTNRISAELERFSGTFVDGQEVQEATDFADIDGDFIELSNSVYNSANQNFQKHGGEPIPYFSGAGTASLTEPFSSRASTAVGVFQFEQDFDRFFTVARLVQGGKTYFELRNGKNYVEVHSGFADSILYEQFTHAGNVVVAACRIDPANSEVSASVNSEITSAPQPVNGESFASGDLMLEFDPEGKADGAKLFDFLTYDEAVPDRKLDKITKQLGYFYAANLSRANKDTFGRGTPKIQNHLFYDQEVMKYDALIATSPVSRRDVNSDITEWTHPRNGKAVAFGSRGRSAVGTENSDVLRLSSGGDLIWEFTGHGDTITAVETGKQGGVYSASKDGTVKKIGRRGSEIWNFGVHTGEVTDLALFRDLAVYSVSKDQSVRRIIENSGDEDTSFEYIGHLSEVTCVEVDKNEIIYTGAANGELRVLNNGGNEVYMSTPADSINGLAVRRDHLFIVSNEKVKKLEKGDGAEVWVYENSSSTFEAVAVHPDGPIFVSDTANELVIKLDDTGSKVSEFSVQRPVTDLSVQPGTFEPHFES